MNLTNEQKQLLTEKLLKECWHIYSSEGANEPDIRICVKCKHYTFEINISKDYRTFLTWDDLGACKEALVRKDLWRSFYEWNGKKSAFARWQAYMPGEWLFRPIDDGGEPHFCRLVVEFMESRL